MSKLFTLASVNGSSLSGANLKASLVSLFNALQAVGVTDSARTTVTASATLTMSQCGILLVDCTSASVVLTLPTSGTTTDEAEFKIRRIDSATANTLTVARGGTDTVEGATTAVSIGVGGQLAFKMPAGATNWRVVSRSGGTAAAARAAIDAIALQRGFIAGLTLSTAGSSATLSVAAGEAADSTNAALMQLSSALSKTTSAWALGTAAGGLDTGAIANSTWYHWYLIRRPDTGVVDVVFSTSASAPTLPTNYTQYRRIGAMKTNGSAQWTSFKQYGDDFYWDTPVLDVNASAVAASALTTFTVPTGVKVKPMLSVSVGQNGVASNSGLVAQLGNGDVSTSVIEVCSSANGPNNTQATATANGFVTDTSARLYYALLNGAVPSLGQAPSNGANAAACVVKTRGWSDSRGKDA